MWASSSELQIICILVRGNGDIERITNYSETVEQLTFNTKPRVLCSTTEHTSSLKVVFPPKNQVKYSHHSSSISLVLRCVPPRSSTVFHCLLIRRETSQSVKPENAPFAFRLKDFLHCFWRHIKCSFVSFHIRSNGAMCLWQVIWKFQSTLARGGWSAQNIP